MSKSGGQAAATASDWAGDRGRKWVENLQATEAMLAPVDAPLVEALQLDGVVSVADIGCGGGRTSRAIARKLSAHAQVHGVDISPDVIKAAGAEGDVDGARLEFFCRDAGRSAPPLDGAYDRLASRFGVMFFDDPPSAFSNLAGWLKPGGRFVFAVWAELDRNPWMVYLRKVIAEIAELPPPVPDAPGPFRYARAKGFVDLLDSSGFSEVAVKGWEGEVSLGGGRNAAETAEFCLSAFSVGELVNNDAQALATAAARLTDAFAGYERDGVVIMPAAVHLVSGSSAA